jgi:hypothetical protein
MRFKCNTLAQAHAIKAFCLLTCCGTTTKARSPTSAATTSMPTTTTTTKPNLTYSKYESYTVDLAFLGFDN